MYKAIFFDLDGTLTESGEGITKSVQYALEKLGKPEEDLDKLRVFRVEQSKLTTVKALQSIGFDTIASGDSYNDLGMIQASKAGFLFRSTF